MSTELAITAVTETLRRLLEGEVKDKWGVDVLSGDLTRQLLFTNLPLHRVRELHDTENVLNLFLYRAEVSAAWRNLAPPAQGKPGESTATPLALHLEYLVTAYGEEDREEVAHYFLGQAMRALHDVPILPRQSLFDAVKQARVHEQIERITVTPRALSIEELSKLWSVFQTQYRVSAAYLATVLLIDSKTVARAPLPVLKRGPDDSGVGSVASAPPALDSAAPASGFSAVRLGEPLIVKGDRLDTGGITARVRHRFMPEAQALPVTLVNAKQLEITIPDVVSAPGIAATWPAGIYSLSLEVARPGQPPWQTNDVPFLLAPSIAITPKLVQPPVATFELTIDATPQVHETQSVVIVFDDLQVAPKPIALPANSDAPSVIKADLPGNVMGLHRVRLRVDGIDSIPIVKTGDALDFDPAQTVEVKS